MRALNAFSPAGSPPRRAVGRVSVGVNGSPPPPFLSSPLSVGSSKILSGGVSGGKIHHPIAERAINANSSADSPIHVAAGFVSTIRVPPPPPPVPVPGEEVRGVSSASGAWCSSPYHHGASVVPSSLPRPLSEAQVRADIAACARVRPAVSDCKPAWFAALDSLEARGADGSWIREARSHIRHGVTVELDSTPAPSSLRNSKSVLKHQQTCLERVRVYADLNAVAEDNEPRLVHPLLAVEKEGRKVRLCLDLSRNFNEHVRKRSFKLLSLRQAVLLSRPGCFYAKMDLSACFLSFPLAPSDSKLMGFRLGGKSYRFTGVPFGLSSAPRVVSLLLDVVSAVLLDRGVEHVRYLDDFLFVGPSASQVLSSMRVAAKTLQEFGLVNNLAKLEGPTQSLEFLGIQIDSVSRTLSVPEHKLKAISSKIENLLSSRSASVKRLRSVLGSLSHISMVLPAARPYLRSLIDSVHCRSLQGRKGPRRLSALLREDLLFWLHHMRDWNGSQRWRAEAEPTVIASDASTRGFGWVLESAPASVRARLPPFMQPGYAVSGEWVGELQSIQSVSANIGWGELFCPVAFVRRSGPALRDSHVIFVLDNSGDVEVINRRKTSSPRLRSLLRELCALSLRYNVAFTAVHRPGARNVLPDVLSRSELHKGDRSVKNICDAVLDKLAEDESPKATQPEPKPFSFGSFFLLDPISKVASSNPVLFPLGVSVLSSSSASLVSRKEAA